MYDDPQLLRSIQWEPGIEVPPFMRSNSAVVHFVSRLGAGDVPIIPDVFVSKAVAVQLWMLLFDSKAAAPELSSMGWRGLYTVLASLSLRMAVIDDGAAREHRVKALQLLLCRKGTRVPGLAVRLKTLAAKRHRDASMASMSFDEAVEHLLKKWDAEPLEFDFRVECCGGGGGGDDPDGSTAEARLQQREDDADISSQARSAPRLDMRTRILEVQMELMAVASRRALKRFGRPLTTWHEAAGELPIDALRIIDAHVSSVSLPRVRREQTYELQAIQLRKQIDELRRENESLKAQLCSSQTDSMRMLRKLEKLRADSAADKAAAELAATAVEREVRAEHERQLKAVKSEAAIRCRTKDNELRDLRVAADESLIDVRNIVTNLERQVKRLQSALGSQSREASAVHAEAAAELQRLQEGRVWTRVREEQAHRERAEAECGEMQEECERLRAEAAAFRG